MGEVCAIRVTQLLHFWSILVDDAMDSVWYGHYVKV